jgi:hypothetical protein
MISISFAEFKRLAAMRRKQAQVEEKAREEALREKELRPDQLLRQAISEQKHLATCPSCDEVVDAEILHPQSGLCPLCHDETRRWQQLNY